MNPLLEIAGLVVRADDGRGHWTETVKGVDLSVSIGEVLALIGESGAGKSTVALAALGYARPGTRLAAGRVLFDGQDVLGLNDRCLRRLRGRDSAYVAQSAQAALNPAIRVGEQIMEPLVIHGIADRPQARRQLADLLSLLDLPRDIADRFPYQASGGQQQRIMLAMAMACEPRLLVLDEPTTALDVTTQLEVLKAIRAATRKAGRAAIYVSHDLAVVAQIADRIIVLQHGRIVEQGPTVQIVERPQQPYTKALLGAVAIRQRQTYAVKAVAGPPPASVLRVSSLDATYEQPRLFRHASHDRKVLCDLSFEVARGEVLAVVGESGSGKSTLARVVAGLHPPLSGTVQLAGVALQPRVRRRSPAQRRAVQIVFQSPDLSLNPEEKIGDGIGRPRQLYFNENRASRDKNVARLLEMMGLPSTYATRFPSELSGGERQRVAIARAFAAEPEIILCDEILSSLDVVIAGEILELMRTLKAKQQVAYLFISHDLTTVAGIADRIAVMYAGMIVELGPPNAVFAPPQHPYTSMLVAAVPHLRLRWLDEALAAAALNQHADAPAINAGGCLFYGRCPVAIPGTCDRQMPDLREMGPGHLIRCHRDPSELMAAQRGKPGIHA